MLEIIQVIYIHRGERIKVPVSLLVLTKRKQEEYRKAMNLNPYKCAKWTGSDQTLPAISSSSGLEDYINIFILKITQSRREIRVQMGL